MLTKTPEGEATISFGYDKAGRPVSVSRPVVTGDPSTGTFGVDYDDAGRKIEESYPDGKTVRATLDANGNNTAQGYFFDKVDALTAMTIGGLTPNTSIPTPAKVDFAYGLSGISQNNRTTCSDAGFVWQEPTLHKTILYGTANNINQYPSVDSVNLTYDGNGCLTNDGTNSYVYDIENKLVSVTTPSNTVDFKYDPLGRLVEKTVGSAKVRYLYSGMQRIEEYNDSGVLQRRYVYGPGLDECLFVVDEPSDTVTYLHSDATGSTILTTAAATGATITRNVYKPWGELDSGSLSDIRIGFTGQFYEPEADLYFFKARHYSPKLGRFLQPDPIGYEGGFNLYEYCGSDPVNFTDPFWLERRSQLRQAS